MSSILSLWNCRVMNENVRTIIPSYKAISLHIVKPFHFTNQLALLLRVVGLV